MTNRPAKHAYARALLQRKANDPLAWWKFSVPRCRQAVSLLHDGVDELYFRKPNKGGGTELACALTVRMLQKHALLDGVPLPQWRGPVHGIVLSLDYNQQKLSVQQTLVRLLGNWPHRLHWKGDGILSSVSIKPLGAGDDPIEWSQLVLMSQENKRAGVGARADIVWADEPPVEDIWREVRKAAHAGRRMVRLISATPLARRQWWWLKDEYGDAPRRSISRLNRKMAEVRWSLDECSHLTAEEQADLRLLYATDPYEKGDNKARTQGDYTDSDGDCPFDDVTLHKMLEQCRDGKTYRIPVEFESTEDGRPNTIERVPVEVWKVPESGRQYYICIDPASGVDDNKHNPACIHVREVGTCDLAARWNGYLAPFSVGVLAASLHRHYGNAVVDVEMKDHWGVNVVRGLTHKGCGNIAYELRELAQGRWAKEAGFDANEETRNIGIGCVQEWIAAWSKGDRYADTPSRAVINTLLDCRLDERGKIVAAPGIDHGEDLVLQGQSLRRAYRRLSALAPEPWVQPLTNDQKLGRAIMGLDDDEEAA